MTTQPETHFLKPNTCAPNNPNLPVLVYRGVLPNPPSEDSTTEHLTRNGWRKDGTWGHISYRHFHPNVHECYGVFSGHSKLLLGRGQGDEDGGIEVDVKTGDVIVLPAGTAHVCLESSEDPAYRYIGVYPAVSPQRDTIAEGGLSTDRTDQSGEARWERNPLTTIGISRKSTAWLRHQRTLSMGMMGR